ncbi:MAG: hypothetical protein RLZZ165_1275, partial [Bacteroidota bacterium]
MKNFDLIADTEGTPPEVVAERILEAFEAWNKAWGG